MSSKPRTKKIVASQLRVGMTVFIPAQRGIVTNTVNADKFTPSFSKGILHVEMKATHGPWRGTAGKTLILENDVIEIELPPLPLRRLVTWLVSFMWA